MCGIGGYVRAGATPPEALLAEMTADLRHRGPEGDGAWTHVYSAAAGRAWCVGLCHARLRILDLTDAAHQPMVTEDGRVALAYNGEIYNYQSLRTELIADGARFTSTGDTAVLLELCRRDPELNFLPRLNGMFAFAVWDSRRGTLTLARDRAGVKPLLHTTVEGGGVAFASEMRPLRRLLAGRECIDAEAVIQHLTLGFTIAPRTILAGVHRLRPGHLLRWSGGATVIRRWAPDPRATAPARDFHEAVHGLRERLKTAVSLRMLADVPVGVFLSGGIDSSVITSVAAQLGGPRVRTFSVGFPENPFYDETAYADAVAKRYGTDHTTLPLTLDEIRGAIPAVLDHLGEPFADSSALPTYLLSRLTRQHVTVALSGDGADELFAGYRRYAAVRLMRRFGWIGRTPGYLPLRRWVERWPTQRETWLGSRVNQLKRALRGLDAVTTRRYANLQRISDDRTLAAMLAHSANAESWGDRCAAELWSHRGDPRDADDLNAHLQTEWSTSLPDDMLMKVDLMSMANALEVRSPFMDFNVVDWVSPLPAMLKLNGWRKKFLLLQAYRDDLPPQLHHRPKKGFEVPVGPWLRGPLYKMARGLIEADRCFCDSFLLKAGLLALLDEHRSGGSDHAFTLWGVVSLLHWQQTHAKGVRLGSGFP